MGGRRLDVGGQGGWYRGVTATGTQPVVRLVPSPAAHRRRSPTREPRAATPPIPPQVDLAAMEREILELWEREDTFAKTLAQTEQGEPWTFYEGPPTANGKPGVHHVEARVFKDVFPRFKTMQGRHVLRKAGWDCHGLPGRDRGGEGARLLRQG